MSFGSLLLLILAILIFCGLLQRVLDRLHMTDRQALLLILIMAAGTFLPDLQFGNVTINLGGALVPLGVCIYLLIRADTVHERWRSIIGSIVAAVLVYLLYRFLPSEAEKMWIEPLWVYGLCGGIVAWLVGRSRRAAFICGIVGVTLADIISFIMATANGYSAELHLGRGGIADASIVSGVMAVLLCETIGELFERITRGKRRENA